MLNISDSYEQLGKRREPIMAATGAAEMLRYATGGDRSTVA